ncbi:MAG: MBL fold metallo-hydrolase [Bacillota bacterium]|nr:MAG: MBL fold metallo-hydrolase [Bacillota bacterium]
MQRVQLTGRVHYLHGAVNFGLVETERGLLVIDSGLDRGAANKILRAAEELGRPLVAVLNTHAHADHFGGNAQLVRKAGIPVYAPEGEDVVIRQPLYEPVYLFGGAAPIAALQSRFLLAEPSPVDHLVRPGERVVIDGVEIEVIDLSGHSLAQVGFLVDGVLFAADSFAGPGALGKHPIPYLVDGERTLQALDRVARVEARWFVPGHGEAVDHTATLAEVLAANRALIERMFEWVTGRLRRGPAGTEDLLAELAAAWEVSIGDPIAYVLARTALLGVLASLERRGEARATVEAGRWLWQL